MIKLFFLLALLGYTIACVTVSVSFSSETKMNVIANNNTASICNSNFTINESITCGNSKANVTLSNYMWKVSSIGHSTGWNKFIVSTDSNGNVIKFGEYGC
jgi:hypothetical protein